MRRSELWKADLELEAQSQVYGGLGKRVVIVSNDSHNQTAGRGLATIPRTTRAPRNPDDRVTLVESPRGDANCNLPGWLDCMQLLRIAKSTHARATNTFWSGPLGTMPPSRMREVGTALLQAISAGPRVGLRLPRGSVISIAKNSARTSWLVVSNEELRARRTFKEPLIVVVFLVETAGPTVGGGLSISFDGEGGARYFVARPATVRTIDIDATRSLDPITDKNSEPIVLPPDSLDPVTTAIANFLEAK